MRCEPLVWIKFVAPIYGDITSCLIETFTQSDCVCQLSVRHLTAVAVFLSAWLRCLASLYLSNIIVGSAASRLVTSWIGRLLQAPPLPHGCTHFINP